VLTLAHKQDMKHDNRDKGEGWQGQDQCTQDDTPIVMMHDGRAMSPPPHFVWAKEGE
jgi:hypothetical protein